MATFEHTGAAGFEAEGENIECYVGPGFKNHADNSERYRYLAYEHAVWAFEAFESHSNRRRQSGNVAYTGCNVGYAGFGEEQAVVA